MLRRYYLDNKLTDWIQCVIYKPQYRGLRFYLNKTATQIHSFVNFSVMNMLRNYEDKLQAALNSTLPLYGEQIGCHSPEFTFGFYTAQKLLMSHTVSTIQHYRAAIELTKNTKRAPFPAHFNSLSYPQMLRVMGKQPII